MIKLGVSLKGVDKVLAGYDFTDKAVYLALIKAADIIAHHLMSWARSHHAYTDRTGLTTKTTFAGILVQTHMMIQIGLWAGMPYDVYLEKDGDSEWSWLVPAVQDNLDFIEGVITKELDAVIGKIEP